MRRTERAMLRAMCGVRLIEKKSSGELMDRLGLDETIDRLAKASAVRWYGHVLRRGEDDVLQRTLNVEAEGNRKRGRPKTTWKRQMEGEVRKLGLSQEDAQDRAKWRRGVYLVKSNKVDPATLVNGDQTGLKLA